MTTLFSCVTGGILGSGAACPPRLRAASPGCVVEPCCQLVKVERCCMAHMFLLVAAWKVVEERYHISEPAAILVDGLYK